MQQKKSPLFCGLFFRIKSWMTRYARPSGHCFAMFASAFGLRSPAFAGMTDWQRRWRQSQRANPSLDPMHQLLDQRRD
ncbi:MAG: hypothetical protein ABIO38_03900, partial [Luteimonas sp.]